MSRAGELLAENKRLRAVNEDQRRQIEDLLDPEVRSMRLENGQLDVAVAGRVVERMALAITAQFRANGPGNYMEMSINARSEPFERYVVTIQKVGAKSPHEFRLEAEAALAEARALNAGVREKPDAQTLKAMVDHAQRISLSASYTWLDYMGDLWQIAHARSLKDKERSDVPAQEKEAGDV